MEYTISKGGEYKYEVTQTHSAASHLPVVMLYFHDMENPNRKIVQAAILLNHKKITIGNDNGFAKFDIQPGQYQFNTGALPYPYVHLKEVSLNLGDTIRYQIYLKEGESVFSD